MKFEPMSFERMTQHPKSKSKIGKACHRRHERSKSSKSFFWQNRTKFVHTFAQVLRNPITVSPPGYDDALELQKIGGTRPVVGCGGGQCDQMVGAKSRPILAILAKTRTLFWNFWPFKDLKLNCPILAKSNAPVTQKLTTFRPPMTGTRSANIDKSPILVTMSGGGLTEELGWFMCVL